MSSIRQQVLFRSLFIILLVIPSILFKTDNKYLKGLEIIILLYGIYQFHRLAFQFQEFIDDVYPPKMSKGEKTEKIHKYFFYGSQILFYCAIFFHLGISWWTRATIFVESLFWISALFGFVTSLLVTIFLVWRKPSIYHESTRRLTVNFGIIFGISILFPAIAIFTNHFFADNFVSCKTYIVDEKTKIGRYNSAWIYITIENKQERFHTNSELFDSIEEKGQVSLCTKKGILGYEFVDEIKIINK